MASPSKANNHKQAKKTLAWVLCAPIRFYRYFISPLTGPSCRFNPTCSQYSLNAIDLHGPLKGGYLSIKRILKCHPWHAGGDDPVSCSNSSNTSNNASNIGVNSSNQHSGSTT